MHFSAPGKTATDVYNALNANVTTAMWDQTLTTIGIQEVDITKLDGSSATQSFATGLAAKWSGAQGAQDIIPQVCALVKFTTSLRGRSHRGRIFLPAPGESVCSNGLLNLANQSAMQLDWDTWLTNMTTAGVTPVVASYKLDTAQAIISLVVERDLATQRRRQPR
jgi:hypothetical protein